MKPLVTIALHTGIERNTPLVENFIKSFLTCNRYPNVELMLIESGNSVAVREWFEKRRSKFKVIEGEKKDVEKE